MFTESLTVVSSFLIEKGLFDLKIKLIYLLDC